MAILELQRKNSGSMRRREILIEEKSEFRTTA
jgi:hypothetical protein